MSTDYAQNTKVPVDTSRMEIEKTLKRFGCVNAVAAEIDGCIRVIFLHDGQPYDMAFPLPDPKSREFQHRKCGTGYSQLTKVGQQAAYEKACRVKWRKVALLVKAKCVAISDMGGDVSFNQEFLTYARLPQGGTVGSFVIPQLQRIVQCGEQLPMIPRAALPEVRKCLG